MKTFLSCLRIRCFLLFCIAQKLQVQPQASVDGLARRIWTNCRNQNEILARASRCRWAIKIQFYAVNTVLPGVTSSQYSGDGHSGCQQQASSNCYWHPESRRMSTPRWSFTWNTNYGFRKKNGLFRSQLEFYMETRKCLSRIYMTSVTCTM